MTRFEYFKGTNNYVPTPWKREWCSTQLPAHLNHRTFEAPTTMTNETLPPTHPLTDPPTHTLLFPSFFKSKHVRKETICAQKVLLVQKVPFQPILEPILSASREHRAMETSSRFARIKLVEPFRQELERGAARTCRSRGPSPRHARFESQKLRRPDRNELAWRRVVGIEMARKDRFAVGAQKRAAQQQEGPKGAFFLPTVAKTGIPSVSFSHTPRRGSAKGR